MAELSGEPVRRRVTALRPATRPGTGARRNPLVALAMALPVAVLLAVAFGGWAQFAAQASSVAHLIGR
jgi:hypothetical protein